MFLLMMVFEDVMSMQNFIEFGEIVFYEMELMKLVQEEEKVVDGFEIVEF